MVIPTFNARELMVRCLQRLDDPAIAQTVVVDDASTDGTVKALQTRHQQDARVRVLRLEFNQGPSVGRNRGLAAATGDMVLFLDSDDMLLPDALGFAEVAFQQVPELQFLTLEGEKTSLEWGTFEQGIVRGRNPGWRAEGFDAELLQQRSIEPPAGVESLPGVLEFGDFFPAVLFGDLFFLSGLVIRRQAALAAGPFNPRYRYLEDWDFTARLCLTGLGGYLDHVGFHRETGRADQLGRAGSTWRRALMHQHVLANLRGTGRVDGVESQLLLERAQAAADYWFGRCLLEQRHDHFGRAYLTRSLRRAYKPVKSLLWLIGGQQLARMPRYQTEA